MGPYDAFIRAITTGRSNCRAHVRATASCAIFDIEYGGDMRRVHLTERIGLEVHVQRIVVRPVDRMRRHHERGLGGAAVRQQQAGALGVDGDGVVEVEPGALERREVHDVGEVVGDIGEVAARDVAHARRHAERVDLSPGLGVAEPGDPPHLVLLHQVAGERERDLPGRSGDEDLLAREHGR